MPKRLPQPDELIVEHAKLTGYLLDSSHAEGASKARFFKSFGFSADAWQVFASALKLHGRTRDVVEEIQSAYGIKYVVRCAVETPDQRRPCISSIWIKEGENPPRLVTAYPHAD